ncbi:MAG TPA: DEAD/DEAH box helicase [Mycobacteriales bacterium]|jgi:superfamily II DNA/RNA helicase|nr:DEAD/DEAH box helicase [Mycobacteriales bacterium]
MVWSIALQGRLSALAREAPALTTTEENDEITAETETEEFEPLAARAPVREDSPLFSELGVAPKIVQALEDVGITRTFAIQEMTLPIALAGSDLIGQARTGTGKTLGFGVPMLQRMELGGSAPRGLVVVPTRELCVQVARDLQAAGKHLGARVTAIYGGRAYEPQVSALKRGVDVIVGTPGRLLDLTNQGHLQLGAVTALVLDEADEMLDLGFLPDIERILSRVPDQRQTMLFSATMPGPIVALARRFMRQPVHVRAEAHEESRVVPQTQQFVYRAHAMDKAEMVARILQAKSRGLAMIFCRTKRTAQKVADDLVDRGFAAAAVHGDLGQGAREQALRAFRSGKVDVLVATDVAARGLDVEGVTHVINYQCPEDEKVYLHRIGRTGRAGASGVAVTFVDWDELARWKMICDALSLPFHSPAETYSTSENLYIDLDIPTESTGRLPRAQRTRAGLDAEEVEDLGETGGRAGAGRRRTRSPAGTRPTSSSSSSSPSSPSEESESRPKRSRSRRRTRAGQPLDESAGSAGSGGSAVEVESGSPDEPVTTAELAGAVATVEADLDGEGARRRRRRRGGRSRRAGEGTDTDTETDSPVAETA